MMMVAAEHLFHDTYDDLYRYLVRLTGDRDLAADFAQETFVRLVERAPAGEVGRAWLFRVATNLLRDDARGRRRRSELLSGAPDRLPHADPPLPPDVALELSEEQRTVQNGLEGLNERDRTILLMREEGYSHREIADAVGTTTKSVGTMIARALRKLASELAVGSE